MSTRQHNALYDSSMYIVHYS